MSDYLHEHKNFSDLIKILAEERGIENSRQSWKV